MNRLDLCAFQSLTRNNRALGIMPLGLTRFAGVVCGGVGEADPVPLNVRARFHS